MLKKVTRSGQLVSKLVMGILSFRILTFQCLVTNLDTRTHDIDFSRVSYRTTWVGQSGFSFVLQAYLSVAQGL